MSQLSSLRDRRAAPRQCLIGKAETEEDNPREGVRRSVRVDSNLMDK
jgi:hypothetical protein